MNNNNPTTKKSKRLVKLITLAILFLLTISGIFLYINFNRLLTEALLKNFDSNVISDVYELKFNNLRVNIFEGSIRVNDVLIQARKKPKQNYPYINSSFKLSTKKLNLIKVDLFLLLKESQLELEEILISEPEIHISLNGERHNFFPFNVSTKVDTKSHKKKLLIGFKLKRFKLNKAAFYGINFFNQQNFEIHDFNLTLNDFFLDQQLAQNNTSIQHLELSIGKSRINLKSSGIKHASIEGYALTVDSLETLKSIDTFIYHFKNIQSDLNSLSILTADSLNHISLGSSKLSYRDKTFQLHNLVFKPNQSDAQIQRHFKYQKVNASGSVKHLIMQGVNYDSLIYHNKISIDQISLDSIMVTVFKDKLKPLDMHRFPEYLGQDIKKIKIPIHIKKVKASHITLFNTERRPDSSFAKVSLKRGSADIENITNYATMKPLLMKVDAYIDNKVHFNMALNFSYLNPSFTYNGGFQKFNLSDLNPLITSYTPAKILSGKVDGITFSGTALKRSTFGTFIFLYHDLKIDLELHNKKKWKSSTIAFAANSLLPTSNPSSPNSAPRHVKFQADRDMNKGFINIVLKGVLNGVKETFVMSKENKKEHRLHQKQLKDKKRK